MLKVKIEDGGLLTNLEGFLKKINPLDIKYKHQNITYRQIFENEAKRFKDILQKHINKYYASYSPRVYKRGEHGGNLRDALSVGEVKIVTTNKARIQVSIEINDNAIHDSIVTGERANAFWILNDGYSVKKDVWFKDIYRFGYYEGAHFVEAAVEEFEKTCRYGLTVEVIRPLVYY